MKKYKLIILLLLTMLLFAFTACGGPRLDKPSSLTIDQNLVLTWKNVENNRGYTIEIKNVDTEEVQERTSQNPKYDLAFLTEGDYDIRVKAIGDQRVNRDSKWSESMAFMREKESGCSYILINNNSEYELRRVGTASGDVVLEDVYRNKRVTSIYKAAFRSNNSVTSIRVGKYVKTIGEAAFQSCQNLTSIEIPDSVVSMGKSAFYGCRKLETVILSDSMTIIEEDTFSYCRALTSVTLPTGLKTIGLKAFESCSALTSLVLPDTVTLISDYAFSQCSALTEFTFGAGVETIGGYAFSGCLALQTVNFGQEGNLKTIGAYAFQNCANLTTEEVETGLKSIYLPDGLETIGMGAFLGSRHLVDVTIPLSVVSVGAYAFNATKIYTDADENNEALVYADTWLVATTEGAKETLTELIKVSTESDIVAGVREPIKAGTVGIADAVFYQFPTLSRVHIPTSVLVIGKYAFADCIAITAANMGTSSVEFIDEYAFMACTSLSNLVMSPTLKKIGSYAFYNCTLVDNNAYDEFALVPATVESIGTYAFNNTKLFSTPAESGIIYAGRWVVGYSTSMRYTPELKDGTIGISDYAFYKSENLMTLIGLNKVEYIGRGAFRLCINLSSVTLNRYMSVISSYAFADCMSLQDVTMPANLEVIEKYAFYKCVSLNKIDLSGTNTEFVGEYAFSRCENVKSIVLGNKLVEIEQYAFFGCLQRATNNPDDPANDGRTLVLPDTLVSIGKRAFSKCIALENITFGAGLQVIGEHAFNSCTSLKQILIPSNIKTIGDYAFYKCSAVELITIEEGLETIGDYAFSDLANVVSLTIPDSVVSIGRYSFKGLNSLTSLLLKSTIKDIGINAFYGCKNLTVYSDAESNPNSWSPRWNSSYRPVVWGCTLSEDGKYVVSVTVGEGFVSNPNALGDIGEPEREGYAFVGWSTQPNGAAEYAASIMDEAPINTVLYAVWVEE